MDYWIVHSSSIKSIPIWVQRYYGHFCMNWGHKQIWIAATPYLVIFLQTIIPEQSYSSLHSWRRAPTRLTLQVNSVVLFFHAHAVRRTLRSHVEIMCSKRTVMHIRYSAYLLRVLSTISSWISSVQPSRAPTLDIMSFDCGQHQEGCDGKEYEACFLLSSPPHLPKIVVHRRFSF